MGALPRTSSLARSATLPYIARVLFFALGSILSLEVSRQDNHESCSCHIKLRQRDVVAVDVHCIEDAAGNLRALGHD